MECLAFEGATFEHFEVFASGFIGWDCWAVFIEAGVEEMNAGFDEVGNILEQKRSALLSVVVDINPLWRWFLAAELFCRRIRNFFTNLITPDVGEANGVEDVDFIDDPADLRFPIDGFEDATRGGWSDDIVGDAFDLHFGPREEGVIASDFEIDMSVRHVEKYFR